MSSFRPGREEASTLPWTHKAQLDVLIDLTAHDDRPTLILDTFTRRILSRNAPFDSHLQSTVNSNRLHSWTDTLCATTPSDAAGAIALPSFAQEEWLGKRVMGTSVMLVFCRRPCLPALKKDNAIQKDDSTTQTQPLNDGHEDADSDAAMSEGQELKDIRMGWLDPKHDPWMSFIRQYPFEKTVLGSISTWIPELRRTVQMMMACPEARLLYWGQDHLAMLYNEAAVPVVGSQHPCLGSPLATTWGQPVAEQIIQTIKAVMLSGRAQQARNVMFVLDRNGFPEQTWHHFHQLPITSTDGRFLGCLCEFVENTTAVVQENRAAVLDEAINAAARATTLAQLWPAFLKSFEKDSVDVVAGLVYSVVPKPGNNGSSVNSSDYVLAASFGPSNTSPKTNLSQSFAHIFERVSDLEKLIVLTKDDSTLPADVGWSFPEDGAPNTICLLPVLDLNKCRIAFALLFMNPQRPFDQGSRSHVLGLGDLLQKSAFFMTLPEEQRRNDAITSALSDKLQVALLKVEKTEETYARMARDAPIGMFMLRPDGSPAFVNDTYLELLGQTRAEFSRNAESGRGWLSSIHDDDQAIVESVWQASVQGKEYVPAEYRIKAPSFPDGYRWLSSISFSERDDFGKVVMIQGWMFDVTPRKLTERLTNEKLQDALETKRATETFLDMFAHEIRNPLSSILQLADGIAGLIGDLKSPSSSDAVDSLADAAQTITLCAKHQKTIIDEVLTFSKLDSNLLVLSVEKAQIPPIIQTSLKMFEVELGNAKIDASMNIEQSYVDLGIDYVLVDPSRLLQVIINFLTNSIKFTKDSATRRITVNVAASTTKPTEKDFGIKFLAPRKDPAKDTSMPPTPTSSNVAEWMTGEELYVYVGVEDTGKGLTQDEAKSLFQRFAQASPKTYKTYGGSGLGLFISRGLSELQGGQIGVKSQAGKGSTFGFFIKTQRTEPPESVSRNNSVASVEALTDVSMLPHKDGEPDVKILTMSSTSKICNVTVQDLHILLAEDNAINQKVMAQQLRKVGVASVHLADHGLDALTFLTSTNFSTQALAPDRATPTPLSIILLDVEMPVMDGLTCIRQIRGRQQRGEIVGHVPVIAITANARPEQVAVALEAGVDEVVTKPFIIRDLVPRMVSLVQKYAGSGGHRVAG